MISSKYCFRVQYPDTDKMGTMHHATYAKYYETARWELFRSIGIPYSSIEKAGFMCPVIRMNFRFIKTTRYDELLTVQTTLTKIKGARMWFEYKLFNEKNELINEAETELAFVRVHDWTPCKIPEFIIKNLQKHRSCSTSA